MGNFPSSSWELRLASSPSQASSPECPTSVQTAEQVSNPNEHLVGDTFSESLWLFRAVHDPIFEAFALETI
eukprot:4377064-Amphidinium_carterae.2